MNLSLIAGERPSANSILDASALLALLLHEPGEERVREAIDQGAVISAVNLAEVASRLVDEGLPDETVIAVLANCEAPIVDFRQSIAIQSGLLRRTTRSLGLSNGDRACLATARDLDIPAVTSDRIWATLDLGIDVQLIR